MSCPGAGSSANKPLHLGDAINIATRSPHAKLNKLILQRLPLAVPPQTSSPSLYVSGLLHVAPIYIAFESLWQNILQPHEGASAQQAAQQCGNEGCDPDHPLLDSNSLALFPFNSGGTLIHRPMLCERVHSALSHLHIPGLLRSSRLRSDIRSLTGWPEHVVEEQLRAVSRTGRLADFISHIKQAVEKNPHVLVAYAWVLYMALFSGGRFIRATLEAGGAEFWKKGMPDQATVTAKERTAATSELDDLDSTRNRHAFAPAAPTESGESPAAWCHVDAAEPGGRLPLDFFRFATPSDGEDLKKEFKKRLTDAESLLSPLEWDNITQEAICIFENMVLLVSQLDMVCGTPVDDVGSLDSWANFLTPRLGSRLRDSVAVAKERTCKATVARNRDGSSDDSVHSAHSYHHTHPISPATALGPDSHKDAGDQPCKAVRFEKRLATPQRLDALRSRGPAATNDGASDAREGVLPHTSAAVVVVNKGMRASSDLGILWNLVLVLALVAVVLGWNLVRQGDALGLGRLPAGGQHVHAGGNDSGA